MTTSSLPLVLSGAARDLAARCESRINELARRMARDSFEELPGYAELPGDVKDLEVAATARYGLRLFLRRVRDPRALPGDFALFRERAAQRAEEGMPLHLLLRSHALAVCVLWQALCEIAGPGDEAALVELSGFLFAAQERIVGAVAETYLDERAALEAEHREQRRTLTRSLLDGTAVAGGEPLDGAGLAHGALVLALHIPATADAPSSPVAVRRRVRRVQTALDRSFGTEVFALLDATGGHAVVPGHREPAEGLADRLRRVCGTGVRLAAVTAAGPQDIPDAARTASEIVRVARACGRPAGLHRLDDILLEYHLSRRDRSSGRIAALLDPIGERPQLVETLRTYLERRQDRRSTARQLGLHPNTVDNRLARIAELTGLDLASPRGTALAIAALLLRQDVC